MDEGNGLGPQTSVYIISSGLLTKIVWNDNMRCFPYWHDSQQIIDLGIKEIFSDMKMWFNTVVLECQDEHVAH